MECFALVDSGAQVSTTTIEFVKQLGMQIHQLDKILQFEATGGGNIPYMRYIEVHLKFLRSKHLMKICLCLL